MYFTKKQTGSPEGANGHRRIVATYDYRDERGALLYQVVRYEPKDFRQRRPGPGGDWVWNLQGTCRVLYRLPELLQARPEKTVFIVEGEKDADKLWSLELVATTCAQGAGKWRSEYSEFLRGRTVVLIPDNDEAGRNHAQQVSVALQGIAAAVLLLELPDLPPKGDVSDWLAGGGDKIKLLELASQVQANLPGAGSSTGKSQAPVFPTAIPSSKLKAVDQSALWLLEGVQAKGGITLLAALWKAGKTTWLAHMLKAYDQGGEFCGRAIQPARVLFVSEEQESRWATRRDDLGLADHVSFLIRPFKAKPDFPTWRVFLAHVKSEAERTNASLIVFDTISALWPVRDENDAAQVQEALIHLQELTGEDRSLLTTHHLRKSDGKEATGARGSGALLSFVDVILELRRENGEDRQNRRRVLTGYGRWDNVIEEVVLELALDGSGYTAHGDRLQAERAKVKGALFTMLPTEAPGKSIDSIIEGWPKPVPRKNTILEVLRQGVDGGDFIRDGAGKRGNPFTYWVKQP